MSSARTGRPAVFLDRDGVLNRPVVRDGKPYPPRSLDEFEVLPGVAEACDALRNAGFVLVVVTNQPDIARGTQTVEDVDRLHRRLNELVRVDAIYVCPHDDADNCECRKPRPGMLLAAAQDHGLDLSRSVCVGDRWRDIEAARRANVRAVHIDWHYQERAAANPDAVVNDLTEAAEWILRASRITKTEEWQ